MNFLKNKLVPTEIRNDIHTLKSEVSTLGSRLTGLEKAQQALREQMIKTVPVAKTPTVFEPRGSLLDQIRQGMKLQPTRPKPAPVAVNNIRPNDAIMNAIAERMKRQRAGISPDADWED